MDDFDFFEDILIFDILFGDEPGGGCGIIVFLAILFIGFLLYCYFTHQSPIL